MRVYSSASPYAVGVYGRGEFERHIPADEERDLVESGHIEIVPVKYRVLSDNFTAGKQGSTVSLALLADHESALILGSHIERAEPETITKKG